ncbi:sensor histidine kinase [Tunicatimonas pelagia]|uniref:sensor histidine kinase n=1 Tax=Tunicatimonas pelagia TaxID=931531 RepID=UPI0026660383|nr:histidine kinase [Tunicatimonas pelagia]WKN41253.1 histidine kinase [Tunicatimonas pelagia]
MRVSLYRQIGSSLRFSALVGTLIMVPIIALQSSDSLSWSEILQRHWPSVLMSIAYTFFLGEGNGYLSRYLTQLVPWIDQPIKRLILGVVVMFAYSFVAILLVQFVAAKLIWEPRCDCAATWEEYYLENMLLPLGITIVIMVFLTSRSFLLSWRQAAIEAEKLKTERVASQYESLKNQVNPHFLFNSLNALTSLVYEDQKQAAKFIKKLSDVYRYVLDNQQKEVVPLRDELQFVQAYVFLQKIRFENNLRVDIQVPESEAMVLPLSLQMLLENAVKHNIVSDDQPLRVRIYLENNDSLVIENTLQPKTSHEYSSGLGLKNIQSRYAHLSGREVEIKNGPDKFIVKLPLLTLEMA